jgi:hypothetical protein
MMVWKTEENTIGTQKINHRFYYWFNIHMATVERSECRYSTYNYLMYTARHNNNTLNAIQYNKTMYNNLETVS